MIENENDLLNNIKESYEKGNYDLVLSLIEKYDSLIRKTYYKICEYKILCLMKLNKIIDAKMIIKEELSVPYIPRDFEAFLHARNKETDNLLNEKNKVSITMEDLENIDKFDNDTLVSVLPKLKDFNLKPLAKKIQRIFDSEAIANLTKTLLIACLSDNQLNYEFYVKKEDVIVKFNPITVYDIRNGDNTSYLNKKLADISLDINLKELAERLYMTYLLDIYPLVISEKTLDNLFTASVYMSHEMFSRPLTNKKISEEYDADKEKIDRIIEKINKLIENV